MTPEHAPSDKRSRYDDDDDLLIRKKSRGNSTLIVILTVAAAALLLLTCILGTTIYVIFSAADTTSARLPGAWKARFDLPGQTIVSVYTFKENGNFREDAFNLQGQLVNVAEGRWRFRNGEIEIDWDNGSFERAVPTWIDDNTIEYHIVDHSDLQQIGLVTTFRRQ